MAHRVTVDLDGAELAANFDKAKAAYPLLVGFSNPRIRPESRIIIDDDTPAGAVEVTLQLQVPPAPGG